MMRYILAAFLPIIHTLVSAQNKGGGTYTPVHTVGSAGPRPTPTFEGPPVPTQTTPAIPPGTGSYQLNKSFEITNTPVTRTYNWTIA